MSRTVWVELDRSGRFPVRIFRNRKDAMDCPNRIDYWVRSLAVKLIRTSLFVRSKSECELCAAPVTSSSGHMHEKIWRGKGGEISLENSIFICPKCHQREHKDRNPRWGKERELYR